MGSGLCSRIEVRALGSRFEHSSSGLGSQVEALALGFKFGISCGGFWLSALGSGSQVEVLALRLMLLTLQDIELVLVIEMINLVMRGISLIGINNSNFH